MSNDAGAYDLNALLHPAAAFEHPDAVVRDTDLTRHEKRAILASWAADVCALDAMPELHELSTRPHVRFDDIADALRALDAGECQPLKTYQRLVRRRHILSGLRRKNEGSGSNAP